MSNPTTPCLICKEPVILLSPVSEPFCDKHFACANSFYAINKKEPREFWVEPNGSYLNEGYHVAYSKNVNGYIRVREVLPDSIQGEKLFELSQTNYKLLQHIETITAKVKRYEEVLKECSKCSCYYSCTCNSDIARAALNQGEDE